MAIATQFHHWIYIHIYIQQFYFLQIIVLFVRCALIVWSSLFFFLENLCSVPKKKKIPHRVLLPVQQFNGRAMNQDPLTVTLTQISILVEHLNKKNLTESIEIINRVSIYCQCISIYLSLLRLNHTFKKKLYVF